MGKILSGSIPLLVVIAFAFVLRLFRLEHHSYRGDETFVVWFVAQDWPTLITAISRNEPHPPIYYVIMKLVRDFLGDSEFLFRFVSVFFGVVSVAAVGRLGTLLLGRTAGVLAAIFLAVSPFHIWYAQDARMYTLAVAAVLMAITTFVLWYREPVSNRLMAGFIAASLFASFSHYAFFPVLLALGFIWLMTYWRTMKNLVRFTIAGLSITVPVAGWLALNHQLLGGYSGNGDSPPLVEAILRTSISYVMGRTGTLPWTTYGALGALLMAIGAITWLVRTRRVGSAAILSLPVIAAFLFQWVASLNNPVFSETYLLPASGVFYVLLAACVVALGKMFRPLLLAGVVVPFVAALALSNYWFDPAFAKGADWRSEAHTIQKDARPDDLILLNYPDPTFEYYYRGLAPVRLIPGTAPFNTLDVERELATILSQHDRLWLVPVRAANWDKDGVVEAWLNANADLTATASFHQVRLSLYETPRGVMASATPRNDTLGSNIRLTGVTGLGPKAAACPAPCSPTIRLIWQATQTPTTDYKVYVHILDAEGTLKAQHDGVPADWQRPTTLWKPNEPVIDAHDIETPLPAGNYRVLVGMYDPSGQRLPSATGDSIDLGTLTVG